MGLIYQWDDTYRQYVVVGHSYTTTETQKYLWGDPGPQMQNVEAPCVYWGGDICLYWRDYISGESGSIPLTDVPAMRSDDV